METTTVLEVTGLQKQYKEFELRDISFTLPKGYIMGYVGQNGSGKTTTLDIITHLRKADGGQSRVDGITFEEQPIAYREAIGYVGDSEMILMDFTIKEMRTVCKDFYRDFDVEKFDAFAKRWKLEGRKKIKEFSRGMRIKLQFAIVLSRKTKVLILDEATNGLDPVVRQQVLELLQEYISDGEHSVLFSTHILSDLEQIADYVFFIHNGRKIFCEAKDEIQEAYMSVRGGLEDLTPQVRSCLIGVRTSGIGFEALIKSDDAACMPQDCVLEKPTIDRIIVHMIQGMEER